MSLWNRQSRCRCPVFENFRTPCRARRRPRPTSTGPSLCTHLMICRHKHRRNSHVCASQAPLAARNHNGAATVSTMVRENLSDHVYGRDNRSYAIARDRSDVRGDLAHPTRPFEDRPTIACVSVAMGASKRTAGRRRHRIPSRPTPLSLIQQKRSPILNGRAWSCCPQVWGMSTNAVPCAAGSRAASSINRRENPLSFRRCAARDRYRRDLVGRKLVDRPRNGFPRRTFIAGVVDRSVTSTRVTPRGKSTRRGRGRRRMGVFLCQRKVGFWRAARNRRNPGRSLRKRRGRDHRGLSVESAEWGKISGTKIRQRVRRRGAQRWMQPRGYDQRRAPMSSIDVAARQAALR